MAGLYGLPLDDLAVYKLALLATDAVQPIGSGGDIAAAAFTGWVAYASPDRAWLRRARTRMNTDKLVRTRWPHLNIHHLIYSACVGAKSIPELSTNLSFI